MKQLSGKVALVTGASSGIGRATAKLFAAEGAQVIVAARRKAELDALVEEIAAEGGAAVALAGDVAQEEYAKALVATAIGHFGGLDIAFNNAGTLGELGPVPDMTLANWRQTLDSNLTSAFLGAKYQIPAMLEREGGSIVFTSSFVGYTAGFPGTAAYASAKAGIVGLTQVLASEYGRLRIRVNAVLPGATETPMAGLMMTTPEERTFIAGLNAFSRIAAPEEIARSVLYLASDASSFTTGTALLADGGVSIHRV